jgi:hypothetical protein
MQNKTRRIGNVMVFSPNKMNDGLRSTSTRTVVVQSSAFNLGVRIRVFLQQQLGDGDGDLVTAVGGDGDR